MGRKIPGKKHRTVKDPLKQNQKRLESVKSKINNPPTNVDEQEIPRRLLEIMELKKKAKEKVSKRPVKKKTKRPPLLSVAKFLDKEPIPKGVTKPEKFIPNIVQKPNESVKSFLGRVSLMTESLINEVEFEKKFGIEIKRNPQTGEVIEIKNIKNKKSKSKKKKLIEKRKAKLNLKKENIQNAKDFSQLKDNIEFGEVVHRPPDLPAIKNQKNLCPKQKFHNLLLRNVVTEKHTNKKTLQSIFEKGKAELERKLIVEAYRKLKNEKRG